MAKKIVNIDCKKWRTGGDSVNNATGTGITSLLNNDGYMCCLGFACRTIDPSIDITNKSEPLDAAWSDEKEEYVRIKGLSTEEGNTEFSQKCMKINDDENTTIWEKIEALKKLNKNKRSPILWRFKNVPKKSKKVGR